MKRAFLLLLFAISFAGLCKANDTLTRAQVYNFSVGDTFIYMSSGFYDGPYGYNGQTTFSQVVITDIYLSSNLDTLFIEGPSFNNVFTNLADYEIALVPLCECFDTTIATGSDPQKWNGRMWNGVEGTGGLESVYVSHEFVEGLGEVYSRSSGGNPYDGWVRNETWLIYYSKGSERWGERPVGIESNNLNHQHRISVYPTLNSGSFYVSMDSLLAKGEFELLDIYGQTIYTAAIQNLQSVITLKEHNPGFYIWRVMAENKVLRSGKLMME